MFVALRWAEWKDLRVVGWGTEMDGSRISPPRAMPGSIGFLPIFGTEEEADAWGGPNAQIIKIGKPEEQPAP